jgi:hypothetical protein
MTFGQMQPCIIRLLDTDGHPDYIATSSRHMLLTDERPDASLGHPDGNKGSDFF